MLSFTLATLALLSLGLTLWQIAVAARFPLHRRSASRDFAPGITILKPLKGCDAETRACLRSWLAQDYPGPTQVLFGTASIDDPVCALVRQLIAEHPHRQAELVICTDQPGPNAKVSQLIELERLAKHEILCVSDADVWAPPDWLAEAVAPLRDERVGLVNCLYRFAAARGLGMRWEAFVVNADFWSQVLQSLSLMPMDFALGAAMLVPRRRLAGIGGFRALVDHLADDYQLGHQIAQQGARIALATAVVECRSAPMGFAEVWRHQLRWARTVRSCRPGSYFLTVLHNGSFWPLLWLAAAPASASLCGAAVCLAVRCAAGVCLEGRMTTKWSVASGGTAIAKDFLQVAVWILAFTGRRITWRGVDYRVKAGGKLVPLPSETPVPFSPA
jgi:ceramide glucosyltransferase